MVISLKALRHRDAPLWVAATTIAVMLLMTEGWPVSDSANMLWQARLTASTFWDGNWAAILPPHGSRASLVDTFMVGLAIVFPSDFFIYKATLIACLAGHAWMIHRWRGDGSLMSVWLFLSPLMMMGSTQLLRESFFVPLLLGSMAYRQRPRLAGFLLLLAFASRPVECLLFTPLLWLVEKDFSRTQKWTILKIAVVGAAVWLLFAGFHMGGWLSHNLLTAPVDWKTSGGHAGSLFAAWGVVAGIDWAVLLISMGLTIFKRKRVPKVELIILMSVTAFMILRPYMNNPLLRFYGIPSVVICSLVWKSFTENLSPFSVWPKILVGLRLLVLVLTMASTSWAPWLPMLVGPLRMTWKENSYDLLQKIPRPGNSRPWAIIGLHPRHPSIPKLNASTLNLLFRARGLGHRFVPYRGSKWPTESQQWIAGPFPGLKMYDYLGQKDLADSIYARFENNELPAVRSLTLGGGEHQGLYLYQLLP